MVAVSRYAVEGDLAVAPADECPDGAEAWAFAQRVLDAGGGAVAERGGRRRRAHRRGGAGHRAEGAEGRWSAGGRWWRRTRRGLPAGMRVIRTPCWRWCCVRPVRPGSACP
ncbi:hypothetical protein ACU686_35275 [Yinghuangia aomiensis]